MSADDLWCLWCRQPHAPCATTPAMEAERAATLRARLEKRYERPERPCTYDPADEEPEGDWTPPRPEPVEYSGIPVVVDPEQEEGTVILAWKPPTPAGIVWTQDTLDAWQARHDAATEIARTPRPASEWMDLAVAPQGGPDLINPTDILYPCRCGARGIHACPLATRYPSDMFADGIPQPCPTVEPNPSFGRVNWINHVVEDPSNGPRLDDSVVRFMERVRTAGLLRSYLRTLTNPDATPEDVAAAMDLLTDEDRELVAALTKRNP